MDDSVETVLINLIRGTGAAGLGGIPWFRPPNVYRPLLQLRRSETRELAALAGLPFFDDPMNEDLDLLRANVRRKIIPEMTALNPGFVENVARMSQTVGRDHQFLESEASLIASGGQLASSLIETLPAPIADRAVARFLAENGAEVNALNIGKVRAVASGEAKSHELGAGRSVVLEASVVKVR